MDQRSRLRDAHTGVECRVFKTDEYNLGVLVPKFAPSYDDLKFMTPLSQERADRLVAFATEGLTSGTVLDLGCGWAELLLQVMAAAPEANGVGIDSDQQAINHARMLAADRGLTHRVTLEAREVSLAELPRADVIICVGASQIWGPPTDDNEPLGYRAALRAIRAMLPPGARTIYGEAIWSRTPNQAAADPLSGRLDEFISLQDLVAITVEEGFQPVSLGEATVDEWDVFESGFSAKFAKWLAQHPSDHPDAADVRMRVAKQREGYLSGYRDVLGMAYLGLVAV
jgi:cyclopropane fatty-acyl-phospholipid synthase-like methyltransferase